MKSIIQTHGIKPALPVSVLLPDGPSRVFCCEEGEAVCTGR